MWPPIARVIYLGNHHSILVGCMNELAVTYINTRMRDEISRGIRIIEEHQIAFLEVFPFGYDFSISSLFMGRVWQFHLKLLEHHHYQTRAIDAFSANTSHLMAYSFESQGIIQQRICIQRLYFQVFFYPPFPIK